MQKPDFARVDTERQQPVQRYDTVQALAGNGAVVVGGTGSGAVLLSTDAGITWTRRPAGNASLIDIAVCPDRSFVAIDFYHRVWWSDADGAAWTPAGLKKPGSALTATCDGKNRWWIAGTNSTIASSADKGATWSISELGEDAQITALQFVDESNAFAAGEFGLVLKSSDGGTSWKKIAKIPGDFYPYAALFTSPREGWLSGLAGQLLHTADGGLTWSRQSNLAGVSMYRLFMHRGRPHGVGASGVVARYEADAWRAVPYAGQGFASLGAGASLGSRGIIVGGAAGMLRVVDDLAERREQPW